ELSAISIFGIPSKTNFVGTHSLRSHSNALRHGCPYLLPHTPAFSGFAPEPAKWMILNKL
ncbi:MAG TPA: hypothetical protein VLT92_03365, partial [Burkholderiales bacterium]|nr:hypothetical protein [Burkholderiales bacterium]